MKRFVLGFEPVWDDYRPHQFLNSDSPSSGFLIQEFEGLFAEGYHYLIRRFFFTLSVFERPKVSSYPWAYFEYVSVIESKNYISLPEAISGKRNYRTGSLGGRPRLPIQYREQ